MSRKFDAFVAELEELCRIHGVTLGGRCDRVTVEDMLGGPDAVVVIWDFIDLTEPDEGELFGDLPLDGLPP